MDENRIPLAALLEYITSQLRQVHENAKAAQARGDHEPIMKFDECELEFAIEAEYKGEAGLHVWVVKAGAGVKRSEANTIKIKYTSLPGPGTVAEVKAPEGAARKPKRQGRKVK